MVKVISRTHTCSQLFITVMDKLRLEIRAMDEVRPWAGGRGKGGSKEPGSGERVPVGAVPSDPA